MKLGTTCSDLRKFLVPAWTTVASSSPPCGTHNAETLQAASLFFFQLPFAFLGWNPRYPNHTLSSPHSRYAVATLITSA